MIDTKRIAAAALALVFSLMVFVVPVDAAGVNQGSISAEEALLLHQSILADMAISSDPSSFPGQPIPYSSSPVTTNNYQSAFFTGSSNSGRSFYCFSSSADYPVYVFYSYDNSTFKTFFASPSNVSVNQGRYEANAVQSSRNVSLSNLDSSTGLYYSAAYWSADYELINPNIPVFNDIASGLSAVGGVISGNGAVLVSNGDSFSFDTDYSVNNTTGVDIAVASYNLGYNDIIVIGCYETVVVPGTIGGMSANYNVNQILPREQHIPIRYCALTSDTTFSSLSPFESLDDAVAACYDILQDSPNHGGGYTPSDVQFTLQPGNVAYIELADLSEKVILSSAKSSYSALFQTAGSYWPGNQLYKSGMDYPIAGTVLPGATPNQIPWQKNEWGSENALGQTKQAYAEITASSNLLMIYNPYYQGDDSSTLTNTQLINSAIVISSKGIARNGIRVYNLKDSFSTVDGNYYYGIGSTNPNGYGDYYQSENDPNATNPDVTGWTNENGDPTTAPGVTPYNDPPDNDSLADVITGFLSNIGSLFTQGHDAIKNLVESSSEFTSRLSALYTWLPPQVYSVLISAIILAIIVGVLKVFL